MFINVMDMPNRIKYTETIQSDIQNTIETLQTKIKNYQEENKKLLEIVSDTHKKIQCMIKQYNN